jgi:DNA polymerase-1
MTENKDSYLFVTDNQGLEEAIKELEGCRVLAIDTETTGLNPLTDKVRLVQLAVVDRPVIVVDLWQVTDSKPLKELLSGKAVKVFHNAKFDLKFLKRTGLPVKGRLFDSMLASKLLTAGIALRGHSLAELVKEYLDEDLPKELQVSDWSSELTKEQIEYAARDASVLLRLRDTLIPEIYDAGLKQVAKLEFDCIPTVVEMELNGIMIDREKLDTLNQLLEATQEELASTLKELFQRDLNANSPKQLLEALHALGIMVKSTSRYTLTPLAEEHEVINFILQYRKAAKAVQAFSSKLPGYIHPQTGRIYPEYNQLGAVTGRFSCKHPNLQQIPRDKHFRACFIHPSGYKLVIADYSQIELRVAAEISQDKTMIKAYKDCLDLHQLTASLVTDIPLEQITKEKRQAAKSVNFGLIFSMGARSLRSYARNTYGVEMTIEEAELFRERFFSSYEGISKWHEKLRYQKGKETRTIAGRRRQWEKWPWVTSRSNTPVQGTAADILKRALGLLPEALNGTEARIIATIHDEIILETPEGIA